MISAIALWTGLLTVVVVVAQVAHRLKLPTPLLLVLAGFGLGAVPWMPPVTLDPDLVLDAILPLLIYTSAVTIPWHEFRRNLGAISLLSVGLVFFTTACVALLAHHVIAGMSWSVAFVLGAVISPPDDVAVATVTDRMPIPRKLVMILEGEGLLNDASALTVFRFALAAAAGGSVSWVHMTGFFAAALIGGIAYGLLVGWVALYLRRILRDTLLEITVSLITPFVAYLGPEYLGLTGIPAVVATGLLVSAQSAEKIPATTRLQVHSLWRITSFWLNSVLFLVLGLELKGIISGAAPLPLATLMRDGLRFSLLIIAVRFFWIYLTGYLAQRVFRALRLPDPLPPSRQLFLIAYAGMRGTISLAAALAVPLWLPNGDPFPDRALILFVAVAAILVTLLGQGLGLPALLRRLGIAADGRREQAQEHRRVLEARIEAVQAGIARLKALAAPGGAQAALVAPLLAERARYLEALGHHFAGSEDVGRRQIAATNLALHREEIAAERAALLRMLAQGRIGDEILVQVERDLDLREMRLQEHALPAPGPGDGPADPNGRAAG